MILLIFVIAEFVLGNELALSGSPYPPVFLVLHVLIAVGLVLGSGAALVVALRLPSVTLRVVAGLTFICALGATISGTLFLEAGQADSALLGMEVLGGVALVGSVLLIVLGSVTVPAVPAPPARS